MTPDSECLRLEPEVETLTSPSASSPSRRAPRARWCAPDSSGTAGR